MGEAIGAILPLAVGVALSPVPIVAVVLMLATPRGRSNGVAFVAGWILGLAVVGTIVLLVSSGADASEEGEPASWVGWVKIVLGLLLFLLGARMWRGRPHAGAEPALPGWMRTIDTFTSARSLGMGLALSGVNPKNLVMIVAAGAAIAQTGMSTGRQGVALGVFVVLGTLGPGLPLAIYVAMGARSREILAAMRDWMGRNSTAIMAVLALVIGFKLLGDGIAVL
jgi:threonine/homoserine/homoserine lactone efflux protein